MLLVFSYHILICFIKIFSIALIILLVIKGLIVAKFDAAIKYENTYLLPVCAEVC